MDLTSLNAPQFSPSRPETTEIYVFGTPAQAHAVGFTRPHLVHREHVFMRAICLQSGEAIFESLRGMPMISRIVVTDAARRAAYNLPYAGMILDKLRYNAKLYLRAHPGAFMEL